VENTNDIIYSTDITGRITNISPQISRYGYTSEDIVSNNLTSFILAEDLPAVLADVEKTVSTGKSTITVFRVKDKSGTIHWMEDNGSAIFDESGGVIGLSGILRDITDRKHAEDALHESEERFRSLVETSPDMIWEIDPQGTFLYVSPMVTRILGYTPDEIIGKSITDLVPEWGRPFAIRELMQYVSSDGPLSPIEVTARHRNGHDTILEIRL